MLIDVRQLSGGLARPNDLTCQVCEKLCENEERFFRHIHKYHPDYWRVFAGGRPLADYIEPPSTSPLSSWSVIHETSHNRSSLTLFENDTFLTIPWTSSATGRCCAE